MEKFPPILKGLFRSWIILLWSLIAAVIVVLIWQVFHEKLHRFFGITPGMTTFNDLASDLVTSTPALVYAALIGFMFNRIMGQTSRLKTAVDTLNALMFLEERNRRMPVVYHIMLMFIVLQITMMLFLCTYSSVEIGRFVIGTFVFISSMIYIVSVELDNPFTGVWKLQDSRKIPDGWLTMTVYDILKNKVEHIGNPHFPRLNQIDRHEYGTDDVG